jgi:adenylate cyclase
VEKDDIYGDGVNIAARLEGLAESGGICISRTVREQIRDKLCYPFEDLGAHSVKNIARPVRAYAMSAAAVASLPPTVSPVQSDANTRKVNDSATPAASRLSMVVLPFANLSNDPEQENLADGITDDLTTDLSRISGSFVIARSTAFTYKGKAVDVKQLGRDLGVRYVIEGSVRCAGSQMMRVNVQLIDAESGAHLWADRFDTDRANLDGAPGEMASQLARIFERLRTVRTERRIAQERVNDPEAQESGLRGRTYLIHYLPTSPLLSYRMDNIIFTELSLPRRMQTV